MKKRNIPAGAALITVALLVPAGVFRCEAGETKAVSSAVFARVNGKAVGADVLLQKIEELYPSTSVHAKPGGSLELRSKAVDAVILDELIWQQAVKAGKVAPLAVAQQEMLRIRRHFGTQAFDASLRESGVSRREYLKKLQRALSIRQARKEHVEIPARAGPKEVRTYFDSNRNRFHRPERARFRLILVAVEANSSKEQEEQARKRADDLYAQLKAGKDFGDLAYEASDDMYRVKGGDVGWMHKGSIDPEFENLALTLPIGEFTAPFRTPPGFSILKVEAREPARDMSFAEVRDKLKAQLTAQKTKQLQQAWEEELKKGARIEIVDQDAGLQPAETSQAAGTALQPAH